MTTTINERLERSEWWLYHAGAGDQMIFYTGESNGSGLEKACKDDPELAELYQWLLRQEAKGNVYLQHSTRGYVAVRTHSIANPIIVNNPNVIECWLSTSKRGETITVYDGPGNIKNVAAKDAGVAAVLEKLETAKDVELTQEPGRLVAKRVASKECSHCPGGLKCCYPRCQDWIAA
jgi:hypothetical protein